MRFELAIFDCDGVLVDSERISHAVLIELLAERGMPMDIESAYSQFLGKSTAQCIAILDELFLAADNATRSRVLLDEYKRRVAIAFATRLEPVPGIVDALDAITVPSCVASSGEHSKMRLTLGRTGLLARFEGRITSVTEVTHPKPAPDVYLLAASKFGARAERCVAIEDSPTGVMSAVAAGMTVLGYAGLTPAHRLRDAGAHQVFDSMRQLPALINSE